MKLPKYYPIPVGTMRWDPSLRLNSFMLLVGIAIAFAVLCITYLIFSGSKNNASNAPQVPPKVTKTHIVLSAAAQSKVEKYSFSNSYINNNSITLCCSMVSC